jgi:hypothetical protein
MNPEDTIKELILFLSAGIDQMSRQYPDNSWDTVMLQLFDDGLISFIPCRPVLPFYYPATIEELGPPSKPHLEFAKDWKRYTKVFTVFRKLYEQAQNAPGEQFCKLFESYHRFRMDCVTEASKSMRTQFRILAHEESGILREVTSLHVSGTPLPSPPAPRTSIQAFARLYGHTHSMIGRSGPMTFEGNDLVALQFLGHEVTDQTLALLDAVPNLRELCASLRTITFESTLVSAGAIRHLQQRLPHVKIKNNSV